MKFAMAWRKLRCSVAMHRRLDVIQSFGSAQHIGCPDCGREFGIHHGQKVVIPWDNDLAQIYKDFGCEDVDGHTRRWHEYRFGGGKT